MASGRGRGRFSGYVCVKFIFFAFNVLFWLLGCAILGIGIWMHIAKGPYASIAPSFQFLSATALCIAAGAIVLVVGFLGCCGAIMENQCMLLTYFLLVVVIFMVEIVAGILGFVYKDEVARVVKTELLIGIKEKYTNEGAEQQGLRMGWMTVQKTFKCCGVNNYTDWYNIRAWEDKEQVPRSCCKEDSQSPDCGQKNNPKLYYQTGCLNELSSFLTRNLYIVGVVGITVGLLQVLGLVAAMALFCCLRNEKYYE